MSRNAPRKQRKHARNNCRTRFFQEITLGVDPGGGGGLGGSRKLAAAVMGVVPCFSFVFPFVFLCFSFVFPFFFFCFSICFPFVFLLVAAVIGVVRRGTCAPTLPGTASRMPPPKLRRGRQSCAGTKGKQRENQGKTKEKQREIKGKNKGKTKEKQHAQPP